MINLKPHLEREYQALKRVREITMQSTYFHQQRNEMTTILSKMKRERSQILMEVKDTEEKILRAMQISREESSEERDNQESGTPL